MSFDLPAGIERDLELYAQAEHITPAEAAVKFIQSGLKAKRRKPIRNELTEAQKEQLRKSPTAAFFGGLADQVLGEMEKASKQIHAERFTSRG
jgi:hypothetical protein